MIEAYLIAKTQELHRGQDSPELQAARLKHAKRQIELELFKQQKEADALGYVFVDD